MSVGINMTDVAQRRVRRPLDKQDLLSILTSANGPFESYRDAMVFCASLGYRNNKRVAFEKTSEQIPWAYFVDANYEPFINMLAVGVSGDAQILGKESHAEKLLLFEEFANGGLVMVQDELANAPLSLPSEVISDIVIAALKQGRTDKGPDLERLASELSE